MKCQLAKIHRNQPITGWYWSEKLDGMRAVWDGGIGRGRLADELDYVKLAKSARGRIATGLWSRYGNIIQAPDWWLDMLPLGISLDGELWLGRGKWNALVSVTRAWRSPREWDQVKYMVFDAPGPAAFDGPIPVGPKRRFFRDVIPFLKGLENEVIEPIQQHRFKTLQHVYDQLGVKEFEEKEIEGIIVRDPLAFYVGKRVGHVLKVKDVHDVEARIVGYKPGKGKYVGMLGAYEMRLPNGTRFFCSGMTDAERETPMPIGSIVTVKYRTLSPDGVPVEPRIKR